MSESIRKILESDHLLVGISELSQMSQVSTRQLRYWEQKGFIHSIDQEDNAARKYRLPTVIKVELIKKYLDDGFTLAKAVEKAEKKAQLAKQVRKIFSHSLKNIEQIDDRFTVISIGPISENKLLHIIHDEQTDQLSYKVLPEGQIVDIRLLDN